MPAWFARISLPQKGQKQFLATGAGEKIAAILGQVMGRRFRHRRPPTAPAWEARRAGWGGLR